MSCKERRCPARWKELSMFGLERRGDMITIYKYRMDSHVEDGGDVFLDPPECRNRTNGFKVQKGRF